MTTAILAALALVAAIASGGNHGTGDHRGNVVPVEVPGLRDDGPRALPEQRARAQQWQLQVAQGRQRSADVHVLRIHNLSADGVATPERVATATATAEPLATPEPTRDAPVFGYGIEATICAYSWPCGEAIAVAGCESEMGRDLYNEQPVWIEGVEHHAVGLFQILYPLHAWRFAGADPYDYAANTSVAYQLWLERGFQPWRVGGC